MIGDTHNEKKLTNNLQLDVVDIDIIYTVYIFK